jgi:hypothetical protein
MVHDKTYFIPVKHFLTADFGELQNGHGRGDVAGEYKVEAGVKQLAGLDPVTTGMRRKQLFGNVHSEAPAVNGVSTLRHAALSGGMLSPSAENMPTRESRLRVGGKDTSCPVRGAAVPGRNVFHTVSHVSCSRGTGKRRFDRSEYLQRIAIMKHWAPQQRPQAESGCANRAQDVSIAS